MELERAQPLIEEADELLAIFVTTRKSSRGKIEHRKSNIENRTSKINKGIVPQRNRLLHYGTNCIETEQSHRG